MINVLVACEESQAVCKEFRKKGFRAFSCDLQECSGGAPEFHIVCDVLQLLNGKTIFRTQDKKIHIIDKWHLIIAHPPCTYLSNAGAARLYKIIDNETYINRNRFEKGLLAKDFFMQFYNCNCEHVAIENPIPSGVYHLPKYTQTIQPFEHGDPYSKKTCLWLKNLPPLQPTNIVKPLCSWVSGGSKKADGTPRINKGTKYRDAKIRSKTFLGIAKAMAEQWGSYIERQVTT